MNHAIPNLQIHIHKVDGATTTFVQNDADEVNRILEGFEPAHIFDRDRFVITDANSITSLPVSKITRIDLISELRPHLLFPVGTVEAVELAESEYETLIRNPIMREQWEQMCTRDGSVVTFLDLEMADGQRLLLTTELRAEQQWNSNFFPLEGSSLCFRMRSGGVAVLNLANLVRLTFFPKPEHSLPDAWHARQFNTPPPSYSGGNPTPVPLVTPSKPTHFQAN